MKVGRIIYTNAKLVLEIFNFVFTDSVELDDQIFDWGIRMIRALLSWLHRYDISIVKHLRMVS
jgi:hypothetical protein